MANQKAYVRSWKEQPLETHSKVFMEFDPGPERARVWESETQAKNACRDFESYGITISSLDGRPCTRFAVEERAPHEFVVSCDYPADLVVS